jgi:ParB/RepB/Spo0J family partition protein
MERLTQYDVYEIPLGEIFFDAEFNCRSFFTPGSVVDLAESIKTGGLRFPIVIQPACDVAGGLLGYNYRILAGHRRYRAMELLRLPTIYANIRKGLTDREALLLNFVENFERKDLNILEEAKVLHTLFPEGASLRAISKEIKRPTRWVHIRLRLLDLPQEVQDLAASGLLNTMGLETVLSRSTPEAQIATAKELAKFKKLHKNSNLPAHLRTKFSRARSKDDVTAMLTKLMDAGLNGFILKFGLWMGGYMTDAELLKELESVGKDSENMRGLYLYLAGAPKVAALRQSLEKLGNEAKPS